MPDYRPVREARDDKVGGIIRRDVSPEGVLSEFVLDWLAGVFATTTVAHLCRMGLSEVERRLLASDPPPSISMEAVAQALFIALAGVACVNLVP